MARFRYGRVYYAYFFEKPIVYPVSVLIVAQSFEEALALVKEQFPDRKISSFHADNDHDLIPDYRAVIVAPNLPKTEPPRLPRNHRGVPEELSRGWFDEKRFEAALGEMSEPQTAEAKAN